MRTKFFAAVIALAFSGGVWAGGDEGCQGNCPRGGGGNQDQKQGQLQGQAQGQIGINKSYNSNYNKASAYSGSSSYSKGGSAKQAQGQVGILKNQGNSNNITFQDSGKADVQYSGGYEVKNVPAVVAPNIYPSSPCMGSSSAGGAGVGFGISFGTSWVDEECQKMEAARNAPTPEDKAFVWCQGKFNAGSPSCAKLAEKAAAIEADKVADASKAARDGDDKRRSGLVVSSTGELEQMDGNGEWVVVSANQASY